MKFRETFSFVPLATGKSLERIRQHRLRFCNVATRPNAAFTNNHFMGDFGRREIKGLVEAGDVFRAIIKFLWGFVIEATGDDAGASFHMDVDAGSVLFAGNKPTSHLEPAACYAALTRSAARARDRDAGRCRFEQAD